MEGKVGMTFAPEEYNAAPLGWDRKAALGVPAYTVVLPEGGIGARENGLSVFAMADWDDKKEAFVEWPFTWALPMKEPVFQIGEERE
ncbi:hypothetical protein [Aneurinibacillus migulanus]|uniref:hypothetical protein n=1 Tax=Aneurinibacillus migulanus TaxID=47500 RepID=UPI000AFD312C|nr:hypothetical protein [Aneurinibacillus migulanus]MCP1359220.1 hypothetical protein [Aneurinibacillus migulanus]